MKDTETIDKPKEVTLTVRFGPLGKIIDFLREVKVELQKVVWPTRQETIQLTIVVILVTIVVGFFLGGIDLGLTKLVNILIGAK